MTCPLYIASSASLGVGYLLSRLLQLTNTKECSIISHKGLYEITYKRCVYICTYLPGKWFSRGWVGTWRQRFEFDRLYLNTHFTFKTQLHKVTFITQITFIFVEWKRATQTHIDYDSYIIVRLCSYERIILSAYIRMYRYLDKIKY